MFIKYFEILNNKRKAKFLKANLDILIEKTKNILESCELCERKCKVNRFSTIGFCKAPNKVLISSEFLHYGEEHFLVPSHTIFFMGCNFKCVYCQNWTISNWFESGFEVSPKILSVFIKKRKEEGSRNINLVGGEPTPYLLFILQTLKILKDENINIPIVWNSNFYMSERIMNILNKIIDIYLPDFKYGNNKCAKRLSLIDNYMDIVTRNLLLAKGELCIRHLILPNHLECCSFPILNWISENLRDKAVINIMDQYYQCFKAKNYEEINRRITKEEYEKVLGCAKKFGLSIL